jgi:hypothetical protein
MRALALVGCVVLLVVSGLGQNKVCGYRQIRALWGDKAIAIQGIRSTIDIVNLGGGVQKSVWVAIVLDSGRFFQIGYLSGPSFFASCLDSNNFCADIQVTQINYPPKLSNGEVRTFYVRKVGGAVWETGVDDIPISLITLGDFDAHSAQLATEESYSCKAFRFPTVHAYPALEFYQDGFWVPAPTARASGLSWGIEGKNQNSSLRPNEVRIGSSIDSSIGGDLW